VAVVVATLMVSAALFVWAVGPELSKQVSQLSTGLPEAAEQAQEKLSDYPVLQDIWHRIQGEIDDQKIENPMSQAKVLFNGLVGVLSGLLLFLAATLYLAFQPQPYVSGFTKTLTKLLGKEEGPRLKEDLHQYLWGFLVGQSQTMVVLGIFTTLGLWLIGMPNFIALGVIAGLLAFVPVIGPLFSVVPALVIALSESPQMALYVLLLYAAIQLVESNLITPILQRRNSELPPVLTLAFQGILGAVCGPLGVFVAAPIAVVFMVAGDHWLEPLGKSE
jgi:predicted PurR-regulated permease PerM